MRRRRKNFAAILGLLMIPLGTVCLSQRDADAAPPTKEECIETHSRAQDYRDRGQMADAKRLFLLCAQQTCPALIQSDCAKFGEDLSRSVPSVSFSARDSKGNDLPDTQVFVDGQLVASRLDDGKAHDLDPGKHTVRFVRNGKESTVNVVIAVGDKGRNITTVLGGDGSSSSSSSSSSASTPSDGDKGSSGPSRPVFPLVVAGLGGAALATGVVLTFVGLGNVPNQCTTSPRECAAAPKDPVFDEAKSAINLANLGIGIGIAGLVIGVGGLIWYFSNSPTGGTASASFSSSSSSASSAKVFRSVATGTIAF